MFFKKKKSEPQEESQKGKESFGLIPEEVMGELYSSLLQITSPLKTTLTNKEVPSVISGQIQSAYKIAVRAQYICNQLCEISAQEKNFSTLRIAPYPAGKVGEYVIHSLKDLLKTGTVDFNFDSSSIANTEIYIDLPKIEFVLRSMLANTLRHSAYIGKVQCTIIQSFINDDNYCSFIILNNAVSANNQTPTADLGIKLMETIVAAHHGLMGAVHKDGTDMQTVLHIPLGKSHFKNDTNVTYIEPKEIIIEEELANEEDEEILNSQADDTTQEWDSDTADNGKYKLLIVEDHKDIRLYLKVLFAHEYTLIMAENGEEGLKMARKELPDLVITDVMMPVMDGFECCKRIKEDLKTCHIPVILLTALIGDEDVVKGIELGADDYILKPFNPEILRTKVKRLIKSRLNLKQIYTKLLMPSGNPLEDKAEEVEKVEDPFIAQILQIVEENLQNPEFSVKKLSEMLNMSQPTLYRRVKQITNFTIVELVRSVRLKRSGKLLKTRQYNVQEVAEMVGYNDIPTFRKHFVDFYGTTPSTFSRDEAER